MLNKVLSIAVFLTVFTPVASVAQNDLFVVVPEAMTALAAQEQTMLEQFRRERATAAVQVVKINANLLKAGPQLAPSRNVNLNFSADKVFAAVATKIDQRSENEFTWYGNVPGKPSAVTLVVKGDKVMGSATIANEQLYAMEPLGSGLHAIIRKDPAKFPPEHPPGFEGIERSRKSLEPKRDQRGDDTGQVIRVLVAYTPAVAAAHSDIGSFFQLAIERKQHFLSEQPDYSSLGACPIPLRLTIRNREITIRIFAGFAKTTMGSWTKFIPFATPMRPTLLF